MPVRRRRAAAVVAIALCLFGFAIGPAQAAPQVWSGPFTMVTYGSQKAGSGLAASLPDSDISATFTMSTKCGTGGCTATAIGPVSSNPTIPYPLTYGWDGQRWKTVYDWVWQCAVAEGQTQWSHARSVAFYAPRPGGFLQGMWQTTIADGACRGTVVTPVAAYPA